jgi:hypothetical protein
MNRCDPKDRIECVQPVPVTSGGIAAGKVPMRNPQETGMSQLNRDQVVAHVHPLDDATIAEIIATGATLSDLKRACAFYVRDRDTHAHGDVPTGRIGDVISILERAGATVQTTILGEAGSTLT